MYRRNINIKALKIDLRAKYKTLRSGMDQDKKYEMDQKIQKKLLSLREYKNQSTIFTYVSKSIEVNTIELIETALSQRKIVAVPKCNTEECTMEFYRIKSLDDLELGAFSVLEPIVDRCEAIKNLTKGLCIVPGFSFDRQGYRLGYGKGYYDRFLSRFGGITVGICYSNCLREELPHGYFDRPVNLLVTDQSIKTISKRPFHKK